MDDKEILQNVKFNPADFIKFDVNVKLVESRHQQVAVTNTTKSVICYKCKGTSPEYIKIRPGYGYLQPGEEVAITVTVLPLNNRPRPPVKERLVVLLAVAPPNPPQSPMQMWRGATTPKNPRRVVLRLRFAGFSHKSSKFSQQHPQQSQRTTCESTKRSARTAKSSNKTNSMKS